MKLVTTLYVAGLALLLAGCVSDTTRLSSSSTSLPPQTTQNVILMIGDGMGLTQISAAMHEREEALELERFETVGLMKTSSAIEEITDSAAGATAFSIGLKTYNGAIGIDQNDQSVETILEMLGKQGYATGVVATSTITHATPASFYAHQDSREKYYEIAADMLTSPLDLFIGGGRSHFEDRTDPTKGAVDDRNLIDEMTTAGFTFVDSLAALEQVNGKVGYFIADGHAEPAVKGRGDILSRSVPSSIRHLRARSEQGFFLMIEGSQIDWGGHANNHEYVVTELFDFDAAVGKALDFAIADGNTLLIVTADHETGGLTLPAELGEDGKPSYVTAGHDFSTKGHTSAMVPVFAYGPGSQGFAGVYENTEIYHKMLQALGRK